MLKIYYGKAKSGKTHRVFSDIGSQQKRAGNACDLFLIVPEQFTLEAEKQFIDQSDSAGFLGIEVVSFKRLAHKVFEEVGKPKGVRISDMGQMMLLRKLFIQNQETLVLYKGMTNKYGFLEKCLDLIKELKQNRITPEQLQESLEKFEQHQVLKNKLNDISIIFKAYELEKEKIYYDDEDFYGFLLDEIHHSDKLKNAKIWIDGFDSFTVQEMEIIQQMALQVQEVTLTLCTDGLIQNGVFEHTDTFYQKLMTFAASQALSFEAVLFERNNEAHFIQHVAENIMAYPYKKMTLTNDSVGVFVADNRLNEVECCASKIVEFIRSGQYIWQDFAIITNALDGYHMSIKRIFDEYKIPYFLDVKAQANHNPLVHLIQTYLELYIDGFSASAMTNFFKTGFFDDDVLSVSAFELYVRQFGIRKKHIFDVFDKDFQDLEGINRMRETLVRVYEPELDHAKVNVKMAVEKIFGFLMTLGIKDKIDDSVKAFIESDQLDQAQIYAQIWNTCILLFDQLVELMGEEAIELDMLSEMLQSGFDAMEVGLLPLNSNHVLIGSIDRSKAHPIKVLFFLGMNDGIVPETANDRQLILDSEKAIFSEYGMKLVSDSKVFVNKEQFNIYFALTRPSERLFFSYARADAEGAALRPSYLVSKLLKILVGINVEDERTVDQKVPYKIASLVGTQKHLAVALRKFADGYPSELEWEMTYAWYAKNHPQMAKWLLEGLSHQNLVNKLAPKTVMQLYDMPLKTSVSRLEQFVQCPFKFFVESGLKPLPQKKYELTAPDIGVLFHSALEIFGKKMVEENQAWETLSKESGDVMVEDIIDQITKDDIYHSKFQYQYLVNKLKRVTKKAVWTLTQQLISGAFTPEAFEVAFGDDSKNAPPIVIELSNGERLFIRGVIDRVDSVELDGKKYIRIIDYKSGKKELSLSEIYYGLQMQLMVYLSACVDNPQYFRANQIYPAGAFYFKIDDPMIESTEELRNLVEEKIATELKLDGICLEDIKVLECFDAELFEQGKSSVIQVKVKKDGGFTKESKLMLESDFNAMLKHVKQTVTDIGDALLEGQIDVSPCKINNFVSCEYCDYQAICQFDKQFAGNHYRKLNPLKNEEVIEKLKE